MTDGLTVTWRGPRDGRRIRFEPLERPAAEGDWYKRVDEEWTGERWREIGSVAVEDVEVEVGGADRLEEALSKFVALDELSALVSQMTEADTMTVGEAETDD